MAIVITPVGGTWALRGGWWQPDSPLFTYLVKFGFEPLRIGGLSYEWDTRLGDSLQFWRSDEDRLSQWKYAGMHLRSFIDAVPYEQRNIIAHSHGGQVAAFCAGLGDDFQIRRLLTVATPNRQDMRPMYARARVRIERWLHVCDKDADNIGFWGMFGDHKVGGSRVIAEAHEHEEFKGIGHSGLLNDPKLFGLWDEKLVNFFRSDAAPDLAA